MPLKRTPSATPRSEGLWKSTALRPADDRFWEKVDARGDCWEWLGAKHPRGYGTFSPKHGKTMRAHRFAYESLIGPIPEGFTLDHLCRNTSCVNPDHLTPATHAENISRSQGTSARNARKTHCPQGHPYTPENTLTPRHSGRRQRVCKACKHEHDRKYDAKRKAARNG